MRTPKFPPKPSTVEGRVDCIADLMARGRWKGRQTASALMAAWALSRESIKEYSAEASRLLRIPKEERDAKRAEMAAWFEAQAHAAMSRKSLLTGLPDAAAALKAMELYGRYAGLEPTPDDGDPANGAPGLVIRLVGATSPESKDDGKP